MKKLLIHYAYEYSGGEFRRVYRLNRDVNSIVSAETIELCFAPLIRVLCVLFNKKKRLSTDSYCFPVLLPFRRFKFIRSVNSFLTSVLCMVVYTMRKPDFVWCETHAAINALKFIPQQKVIFDLHGAAPEELLYTNGSGSAFEDAQKSEEKMYNTFRTFIVQSEEMKNALIRKYGNQNKNICVYQCGVNLTTFDYNKVDSANIRKQKGYDEDDVIFIYVGGCHKWQMLNETISIFKIIEQGNVRARLLLILQGNTDGIRALCNNLCLKNVRIYEDVSPCEVNHYLSISDFAWLLREDSLLNRVASPTKLGEYLACGLHVVTTDIANSWPWIKDYKDSFLVVNPNNTANAAAEILHYLNSYKKGNHRAIIRTIAQENLSESSDLERLKYHLKTNELFH